MGILENPLLQLARFIVLCIPDVNNFSIFRYGPWMDTNLAVPLDATRCKVVFDYFLDRSLLVESIFLFSYSYFMSLQYILCTAHIVLNLDGII